MEDERGAGGKRRSLVPDEDDQPCDKDATEGVVLVEPRVGQATDEIEGEKGVPVAKQTVDTKEGKERDSPGVEAIDNAGNWLDEASVEACV